MVCISGETFNGYSQQKVIQTKRRKTVTKNAPTTSVEKQNKGITSDEVRKRQEAAKKEIKQTEDKIKANEAQVRTTLNELGIIEGQISATQKKVTEATGVINTLNNKITKLEENIAKHEGDLTTLREEYLKAIKKMRLTKNNKSELAFVFSSDNFNQAMRRVRYMKEFSSWRERQAEDINAKVEELKGEKVQLAKARDEQRKALAMQKINNAELLKQQYREQELLAELRKNGDALQRHLQKKQQEANELGTMVNQLIAKEQEAERQRREEEKKLQNNVDSKENQQISQNKVRKKTKSTVTNKETATTESKKIDNTKNNKKQEYASARKRKPRSQTSRSAEEVRPVEETGFYAMKGRLPNPVNGRFIITSHFGRQNMPDMPNVEYQNPGIDAEVDLGSEAQAVYGGKVSGVYLLPGYNTVVILNHDGYYTVYGNISTASVRVGQKVEAGQKLGTLSTSEDDPNKGSIHFEVWKNREKQNPEEWIK